MVVSKQNRRQSRLHTPGDVMQRSGSLDHTKIDSGYQLIPTSPQHQDCFTSPLANSYSDSASSVSHHHNVPRSITAHRRQRRKICPVTASEPGPLNLHQEQHTAKPSNLFPKCQTSRLSLYLRYSAPYNHAKDRAPIPRSIKRHLAQEPCAHATGNFLHRRRSHGLRLHFLCRSDTCWATVS